MSSSPEKPLQPKVVRIGILLCQTKKLNTSALKFLILHLNTLQKAFEYELLDCDQQDDFIKELSRNSVVNRENIRKQAPYFLDRYKEDLKAQVKNYQLKESIPDNFLIITMGRFHDDWYSMRQGKLSVLALGNWKRFMAPPSLVEFILTLIVRDSVARISPALKGSVHLGTKGCLCDFTASLEETRFKVLQGFVCSHCRSVLQADKLPELADELVYITGKQWIGKPTDPQSPAGIASNLGYNLFITKGLKATPWENFLNLIQQEGAKQVITVVGGIILAFAVLRLGLK